MNAFETTPEQFVHAARIASAMASRNLPDEFVAAALSLARSSRGAYELMAMWEEAESDEDRDQAVICIQELLDDQESAPQLPAKKPRIGFDQLDDVAAKVVEAKKKLRNLIDKHGGISTVARLAGIPQPSLSRMLNSASMPRRTTLNRIANALDIPETEVVTDFTW